MGYLENQATNFINQFKRIQSFNKTINGKLEKKDVFANVTSLLLSSLGGDASNISCGDSGSNDTTAAATAYTTYTSLSNCSTLISANCTMPDDVLPSSVLSDFEACVTKFNNIRDKAEACRTNSTNAEDGAAACECWNNVNTMISKVKESSKCSASSYSKAVKTFNQNCVSAFSSCRTLEDASVQLVYTCGSGDVKKSSSS